MLHVWGKGKCIQRFDQETQSKKRMEDLDIFGPVLLKQILKTGIVCGHVNKPTYSIKSGEFL
jgi:hypothetical protein